MHRHVKKLWTHDVGLTVLLGMLFMQIFVLYPFETSAVGKMVVHISFSLILISGAMTVVGTPIWGRVILVFVILSLISRSVSGIYPSVLLDSLNALMAAIYFALLIIVILLQVFREGPINAHRIAGAVSVYLLIGMAWGSMYLFVDLQLPGSFSLAQIHTHTGVHSLAVKLYYFSFITLTSVGYGDIYPVHPAAQSLTMLEALVGQLFPAILLARLVSMEIENRQDKRNRGPDDPR